MNSDRKSWRAQRANHFCKMLVRAHAETYNIAHFLITFWVPLAAGRPPKPQVPSFAVVSATWKLPFLGFAGSWLRF
jgi:hypothetical protein